MALNGSVGRAGRRRPGRQRASRDGSEPGPDGRVTHAVVEMLVRVAEESGAPLDELCEGLPVDERTLRRTFTGLEWDVFVQMLERLAARVGAARVLEMSGRVPDISPIGQRLLGRFVSARLLLSFVGRVLGPSMYPMYETSWSEVEQPDGSLVAHIRIRLKPGFFGSKLMFDIHAVANAAVPTFIGQPPFPTRAETTPFGGDYWFTVRPARDSAGER